MSKSILISIRPEWCEIIANGQKTIEVRKTRPKLETPFECYIYCSNSGAYLNRHNGIVYLEKRDILGGRGNGLYERMNGLIIGEFVCDRVLIVDCDSVEPFDRETLEYIGNETCLTRDELFKYTKGRCAYGWHISDLKIYDEPMELTNFIRPKKCGNAYDCETCKPVHPCSTRPPQSWCYVEDAT